MNKRITRINELIREELAKIIEEEIDLESGILITIIRVDASKDLRYAKVLVGILPDSKSGSSFRALTKQVYNIQQLLNEKLSMKPVPRIRFDLDIGGKRYTKIENIIQEIKKDDIPKN